MNVNSLKKEIIVRKKRINRNSDIYVIGEIACGHQGDVGQAIELIDAAAEAQADAVQLEFFHAPSNVVDSLPFYKLVEELSFTPAEWGRIVSHARRYDIAVSAFIYDDTGLQWALDLEPDLIKLNSSDISNPDLLIPVARSGIPFTLGTGASSIEEITKAVNVSLKNGDGSLILQHGVQSFPTPSHEAHIRRIRLLQDEFDCLVMYADHTDANLELALTLDLVAIGMGACAVEKHLVMKRLNKGVDWEAALEPEEFKRYVDIMRTGSAALGPDHILAPTENDERYRRFQKKSIVAATDLQMGTTLKREHVAFLRAQGDQEGLSPMQWNLIANKRLTSDLAKGGQITMSHVKKT